MKFTHSLGLQDSVSPVMFHISSFHDQAMVIIMFIVSFVLFMFYSLLVSKSSVRSMKSNEFLETIWTILPSIVLVGLAAPSLMTLYLTDEISSPFVSVKVTGHQWFWSYEFGDDLVSFDSYMIPSSELSEGSLRLLECDNRVPVPLEKEIQLIITSSDVIHSWALPSAGVKMDAVPGRLNQSVLTCLRAGVIYGQCSEICGSFHSFMPICLEIVSLEDFCKFLCSN